MKDKINPLKELEGKGNHLAKEEKETKLKRRTILFFESDKNTIIFHKYASHTRNIKIIWENNKLYNSMVNRSFKEIAKVRKKHFKSLMAANICEIMKIIRLFPSIISDEMNIGLEEKVSKEEIKVVLN